MPKGIIKKKAEVKSREMKVFFNEEIPDQPLPELTNYEEIQYRPKKLADIKQSEGTKLTGIEAGAMNLANHTSNELPEGTINKYLLDLSVTEAKLAALAIATGKIQDDAVTAAKVYKAGAVITLSAQIGTAIIQTAHIGDLQVINAKIADLSADKINVGTLTGRTVRTNTTGYNRVQMTGATDTLEWITSTNVTSTKMVQYAWTQGTGFKITHWDEVGIDLAVGTTIYRAGFFRIIAGVTYFFGITETGVSCEFNLSVTGNISVTGTVDGVDISVFKTSYDSHVANASAHHSSTSDGLNITPLTVTATSTIQGGLLRTTGNITGPASDWFIYRGTDKHLLFAAANLECYKNFVPILHNAYTLGAADRKWSWIYAVSNGIGDLHFQDKKTGKTLFRIDEDPIFLNFYNEENKKIAKLDQEGNLFIKGRILKLI